MNRSRHAPAVTSLPQAPQDEATGRVRRYVLTMVIRMVCFGLTLFVTPYGWYTWVFAIATAVLPYIAVVFANAINPTTTSGAESPTQQLPASVSPVAPAADSSTPSTITIQETRSDADALQNRAKHPGDGQGDAREGKGDGAA
ncbi:DUF3099 domain-containing protein [Microbacterium murale]|uniref:DUF3099 domain-containing protein n=1 Tax=Microbacterium murale TaxID=1081040 RepID=A0ABU0PDI9_9MICO|nr:DUF3099 domain-containing protein [Microbacterium murale]MDQ0645383.1 hypothetical protein [Microbacterium murale]